MSVKDILLKKYTLTTNTVITLSVLYMILFDNHTFWSSLFSVVDLSRPQIYLFLAGSFMLIFAVCFTFFSVFGIGRLLKPLITLVLIIASLTSYYMDNYGTVFNSDMVQNIIETNVHEAAELFDFSIVFHVFIFGVIPSILLWWITIKHCRFFYALRNRVVSVVVVIALATGVIYASYKDFTFIFRQNKEISFFVNPVFPLRAVYRYYEKKYHQRNRHFQAVFSDAHRIGKTKRRSVFVIVVGETARAHNFHLNGYKRETTPNLEKHNIINFRQVTSCGTATAVSVPCMFSDLQRKNFDDNVARSRQNLLDALKIAGYQVLWRENNPDCKGVCDRINTQQIADFYVGKLCHNGRCYDEALLHSLDKYINKLKTDAVIVLHAQGSHGPAYYRRYPKAFRKFLPECRSSSVQNCSNEQVVNSYDNTILYTDYFLSKVIDYLKSNPETVNSGMLYLSDHGESLGEKGVYLHGLPYFMAPDYQKHIPMILWLSKEFINDKQLNISCLKKKTDEPLSQDNLTDSILGLMDVSAKLYNRKLDIFASCRPVPGK